MNTLLNSVRQGFRSGAMWLMTRLDRLAKGKISPTAITMVGLLMHVPVAILIATDRFLWAAALLIIFGLFDVLDGALARVQGTTSQKGMLLDASTDRFKEVLLYGGAAYILSAGPNPRMAATLAAVAAGASVCVSYVKAKGEAAVASLDRKIPHAVLNRMFSDGLLTFEMRVAVLVAGLVFDVLFWAVAVIAVLASVTAIQRLVIISRRL
jgi:phosphatidylglycerophosphate synthase